MIKFITRVLAFCFATIYQIINDTIITTTVSDNHLAIS
uniref:Uncharacterized protein n=1 Tax=Shigella sonnei TaxID=624 RepID=A0A1X9QBJ3_SHISO|nr:hypothetical protein [Shigella sonnei]